MSKRKEATAVVRIDKKVRDSVIRLVDRRVPTLRNRSEVFRSLLKVGLALHALNPEMAEKLRELST